ncbi:MAG: glycerate kinase type-2 family protein [Terriglobales bacterium]
MTPVPQDASREERAAEMRAAARSIFRDVLAECSIARAFERQVECRRGVLRIADDLHNLDAYGRVLVLSMGKAAHAMVEALTREVGGRGEGIVAGGTDPASQVAGFRYFRGGHPLPNAESLAAASAMLRTLEAQKEDALVLYMISGGASALVEKPIDDDISLADLISTYQALVHSGAPIAEINAIRKHLSAVKGGRMARAAREAQQVSILISDVPANAPDALASGPTMPDSTTCEDCYRIAREYGMLEKFPASVRELFEQHALEETPKADGAVFRRSRWWPILSSTTAERAAVESAKQAGFAVEVDNRCDDWDYARAADHLLARAKELRRASERVCIVSAGEVTVRVGAESGTGGRNQQFALYCATKIAGQNITVLSAGTDGTDGNSTAAGAIADGTTLARAKQRGLDVARAVERFDAFPVLEALGDAVITGPTGTNVRDVRVLMAW